MKSIFYIFFSFVLCLSLTGCLGDNTTETVVTGLQNATVKSFTLEDNSNVCANLSKYAFTIDNFGKSDPELAAKMKGAGIIFNPDSLPVGTEADSITIKMEYDNVSSVLFKQYNDAGVLKNVVNFKDTQYISFDDYAVTRLDIVSADGGFAKSYFIKVNVHKTYGDTIRWQYRAKDLWATDEITDQTVDTIGNTLCWFTEHNGSTVKVSTANIKGDIKAWSAQTEISADEMPVLSTVYNWNGILYAAGKEGALLSSADGMTWSKAESAYKFVSILGAQFATKKYNEHLHAVINDEGTYKFALTYDGKEWETADVCPKNFPVRNFSRPVSDKAHPSTGNVTSRVYIVGGETADGTVVSSTWSCDGYSWAEFEQRFLPAMTRPAIIEYTLDRDKPMSLWILWPGVLADGSVRNTPYFSENKGVTWKLLKSEFSSYATTSPLNAAGGVSAFMNPDNYWMYFFGGNDAEGKPLANIFGGQLLKLTYDKIR